MVKGVIGGIQWSIAQLESLIDIPPIRRAAELIHAARMNYIFGIGASGLAAQDAAALAAVGATNIPQAKRVKRIAELAAELYDETAKLETVLAEAQEVEDPFSKAKAYFEKVRPAMDAVRARGDGLEKLVAKQAWPFPGYEELLFKL